MSWPLGIKTNAAHQLLFRARNRLRLCIEKELRETTRDGVDLDAERRLVFERIDAESPGLRPDATPGDPAD